MNKMESLPVTVDDVSTRHAIQQVYDELVTGKKKKEMGKSLEI